MTTVVRLQARLRNLGLYLAAVDGVPGGATCDALVRFLAGPNSPPVGPSLSRALRATWWGYPSRLNMLLAQVNAECGFRSIAEHLNYSAARLCEVWPTRFVPAHGGRADPDVYAYNPGPLANLVYSGRDGNCAPGDGFKYRGRGWPQLTGRANYRTFSDAAGVNLELSPDMALQYDITARVTVAFMERTLGMIAAADAGDVAQVRHLWNGGATGLQCASDSFAKLQLLWGPP